MAHDIDTTTGRAAFYSHRQTPWHGLGTVVDEAQDSDGALRMGGLDWDVTLRPVFFGAFDESNMGTGRVPNKFATVRGDTEAALGIVGRRYVPVQNATAFRFLTELVTDGAATFETAGALDNGRRVFLSMLLPDDVILDEAGAADLVKVYILAVNSHDGTSPLSVVITPVRAVCANTVRYATQSAVTRWAVRHTGDPVQRAEEAQRTLKLSVNYVERWRQDATRMIQTPLSDAAFEQLLEDLFPIDRDDSARVRTNLQARRDQAMGLFTEADTQANIRGTVWAAEAALIEQLDWFAPVRAPKSLTEDLVRGARVVEGTFDERKTGLHRRLLTLTNR
jgi:phage/plasmid-like protein (TIGR03299 family)